MNPSLLRFSSSYQILTEKLKDVCASCAQTSLRMIRVQIGEDYSPWKKTNFIKKRGKKTENEKRVGKMTQA